MGQREFLELTASGLEKLDDESPSFVHSYLHTVLNTLEEGWDGRAPLVEFIDTRAETERDYGYTGKVAAAHRKGFRKAIESAVLRGYVRLGVG